MESVDPSRIIVMGRSIGSGPSVDLVSRYWDVRGMVLVSPMKSGAATFGPRIRELGYNLDLDIFRNIDKLGDIKCPVLVMHAKKDNVVPWEHGQEIHAACKNTVEPLWLPSCGHNNMPETVMLTRIREFLDQLDGLGFAYSIFLSKVASHMTVTL